MTLNARKDVDADFTTEELLLLIGASLDGEKKNEAGDMLYRKFKGSGYMSGYEIEDAAYSLDPEKYNCGGFDDIDW